MKGNCETGNKTCGLKLAGKHVTIPHIYGLLESSLINVTLRFLESNVRLKIDKTTKHRVKEAQSDFKYGGGKY